MKSLTRYYAKDQTGSRREIICIFSTATETGRELFDSSNPRFVHRVVLEQGCINWVLCETGGLFPMNTETEVWNRGVEIIER